MMKGSKGIVGLFLALFVLISGVCVGDDSSDILNFLPAFVKRAKFGNAVAKPFFIVPGVSTPVTITAYIPDADLVADSVQLKDGTALIGNLTDTGNKVFSLTHNFQRDSGGAIKLSIAATFGAVNKTIAQFEIKVLSLVTIQNASQYNQNVDNIFATLVAAQENFQALKDPSTPSAQFSSHLSAAKDRLLSVYGNMEAIYRAETHSPSNYPRAEASYMGLGDILQSAQDIIDDREAFRDDPNYAQNPRYAGMRELLSNLGWNIDNPTDRYDAAQLYLTHGPDSKFVKDFIPVTETTIKKKLGEQFTDLAGNAIGTAYGGVSLFGTFIGMGINAVNHKIIDIFMSNTGKKGFIVAEVQDGEALQLPAGSHDVLFSFAGVLDRAIVRNIPVNPNLTTTVNIAPGETKLCKYSYQDLGTLGGSSSVAYGINASGQIVGEWYASGYCHAFLKNPGQPMENLGTLGGTESEAFGINDSGQIVGWSYPATGARHAFLKNPGQPMENLGNLGNSINFSKAYGINASGQIVGESEFIYGYAPTHAFLKNAGKPMQDLGTLSGYEFGGAYGINASGKVVGVAYDAYYHIKPSLAFLWTPSSGMKDLNTLTVNLPLGVSLSSARAINDSGYIVGQNSLNHAFFWTLFGGMQDLGTLGGTDSDAYGINSSGQVVGYSSPISGGAHAFLWTLSEGMKDLNGLVINLPAGITLYEAKAINDAGQIVGYTSDNRAFLLTPIP